MRIFVLGAGASGSFLAQLLARQGHRVTCGDKDPERARRFLGKKSPLVVVPANARNVRSVVRAARGCHLLVNASPAKFNETALRAALRLRAHYLDLSAHMARHPFKAEQLAYAKRFAAKRRAAVINAGVAPGLTNLLAARASEMLDHVEALHIRLYESTEGHDPVSQWSAEGSFDEAVSRPRVVRDGRFHLAKRFSERERFRFPPPIGEVSVVLAAQDEVGTLPHNISLKQMDVKFGGNEIDRLRRWHRQGKLHRSRGLVAVRFPHTPTPRQVAHLIRRGRLQNARFAAAVIARGLRKEKPLEIRWDVAFPTLYQIRIRGLGVTPITYATAHMAALFVRHFPRNLHGVFPPETLPAEVRQAVLGGARARGFRITVKTTRWKPPQQEEDW
jgi:NAD(P)-dependent dehydrogenase (short-subunit alcohol dehydrogenase family)